MKNNFELVVAMDLKRGIGKNGVLPWNLPSDLKHFREVTTLTEKPGFRNAVIMGRKTWESIPEKFRPLPSRLNIILSRNPDLKVASQVCVASSLDAALKHAQNAPAVEKIFVIGGAQVFQEALDHPSCRAIQLTQILKEFDCDSFFPPIDHRWKEAERTSVQKDGPVDFYFAQFLKD